MALTAAQPAACEIPDRPPVTWTDRGTLRRVGVEVEFMGLSVREAVAALAVGLGGVVVEEDPHAATILNTRIGDLSVELDLRHAHPQRHAETLPVRLGPWGAALLGSALGRFVPRELITAPLPMDRLDDVDRAVAILRAAGATGQGSGLGLHFNVDVPALDAATIAAYLKAFLLLDPWLRHVTGEKLPAPYPVDYARRVLVSDYWPDLPTLADDYLAANPTRDRGLDLLPLLLFLDRARVRHLLPREKIAPRPVFHYRVPQAFVGVEGWSIAGDWRRWIAVERLADDDGALRALGQAYAGFQGSEAEWVRYVEAFATR
jgi:hypothetical protein